VNQVAKLGCVGKVSGSEKYPGFGLKNAHPSMALVLVAETLRVWARWRSPQHPQLNSSKPLVQTTKSYWESRRAGMQHIGGPWILECSIFESETCCGISDVGWLHMRCLATSSWVDMLTLFTASLVPALCFACNRDCMSLSLSYVTVTIFNEGGCLLKKTLVLLLSQLPTLFSWSLIIFINTPFFH
jgi:hypothetical protein